MESFHYKTVKMSVPVQDNEEVTSWADLDAGQQKIIREAVEKIATNTRIIARVWEGPDKAIMVSAMIQMLVSNVLGGGAATSVLACLLPDKAAWQELLQEVEDTVEDTKDDDTDEQEEVKKRKTPKAKQSRAKVTAQASPAGKKAAKGVKAITEQEDDESAVWDNMFG